MTNHFCAPLFDGTCDMDDESAENKYNNNNNN